MKLFAVFCVIFVISSVIGDANSKNPQDDEIIVEEPIEIDDLAIDDAVNPGYVYSLQDFNPNYGDSEYVDSSLDVDSLNVEPGYMNPPTDNENFYVELDETLGETDTEAIPTETVTDQTTTEAITGEVITGESITEVVVTKETITEAAVTKEAVTEPSTTQQTTTVRRPDRPSEPRPRSTTTKVTDPEQTTTQGPISTTPKVTEPEQTTTEEAVTEVDVTEIDVTEQTSTQQTLPEQPTTQGPRSTTPKVTEPEQSTTQEPRSTQTKPNVTCTKRQYKKHPSRMNSRASTTKKCTKPTKVPKKTTCRSRN